VHLRENGFLVDARDVQSLVPIKQRHEVPRELEGCHTAIVDGYVVEGHVPADVIRKLLEDRPDVIGVSVPGMPSGSPGMEMPGRTPERYDVLAFAADGKTTIFARR
jgi:hypothetical protein